MTRTVDPADLTPGEAYELLTQAITPRPIAFVSTISTDGVPNLAPFSFFTAGGAAPPSLVFSVVLNSKGGGKDTLRNIEETGEFVVNTLTRDMADGMNATSASLPADESEWPASGFTPVPSVLVKPARVLESPASFECRLFKVVAHGEGPTAARYIIGEVVRFHLAEPFPQPLIARLDGPNYMDSADGSHFSLKRPSSRPQNG